MVGTRGIVGRCCCGNNSPEPRLRDGGASRESSGVERVREVKEVCLWRCDIAGVALAPQMRAEVLRDTLQPSLKSPNQDSHISTYGLRIV